jgi:signal peptidase I
LGGCNFQFQSSEAIMTTSSSTSTIQNPAKSSWLVGCLVVVLISLFALLGIYNLLWGSILAYIFSSAQMLSFLNIGIVLLVLCQCFIYLLLVFRIKRQHWLFSLALVAVAWFVLPIILSLMINVSTARVRTDGFGMGSTLPDQSYILADRLAYQQHEPQRGDIIIFQFPVNPENDLIKRVIGLPGETVTVQDGIVSVNGTPLEEPYITEPPAYNGIWDIPEGQYFVLGDNRNDSRDSHQWGFLPHENIVAKAVWIYWPLGHFGKVVDGNFPP